METQIQTLKEAIVADYARFTEAQIRDLVGAPSIEEEDECLCGKKINECDEAYVHITSGC